jgi:branched-chain amino acid transport system substrate-binding protein
MAASFNWYALDDGYETERTLANTRTLINDKKAFALISFYGSTPTTEAMNKVFGPAKVPLVGTISGAGTLREPVSANPNSRYMFHVRASYGDETNLIVNQMVSLGLKSIAVFYQNDGFGKAGLEGVTAALKKYNLSPSAIGTVERNSLDVSAAVQSISKANPQAVVMVTLYKPTAAFVRAMKRVGQNPMFMTLSLLARSNWSRNSARKRGELASRRSFPIHGTTSCRWFAITRNSPQNPATTRITDWRAT